MTQENKKPPHYETVVFSLESLYDSCLESNKEFSEFAEFYRSFPNLKERYSDEKMIASGGMKVIYKVFDQQVGRYLAMAKLIDAENEKSYMPFIREAKLTGNLEHPNIIKVHEIGFYDSSKPYFTMELKSGDSLKDILIALNKKDKSYLARYKLRSLLVIFLKVCDAVSYSHSRKVIHLDIKPENIQVGDFGEVMLCDWGLAKVIGLEDLGEGGDLVLDPNLLNNLTLNSEIKGTPGYMAPEQVAKNAEKDERTDIYSLGALLYSILTYTVPIEGELEDVLVKTVQGSLIPPGQRVTDLSVPEGLEAVIMKAMSVDKDDRYQNVLDLIDDINRYLDGYSPAAEEAGFRKELLLFYKRNKKVCLLSFLFLFILISSSLYFISSLKKSRDEALVQKNKAELNLNKYKEEKSYLDPILSSDPTPLILQLKDKLFSELEYDSETSMNALIKAFERISESKPSHIPLYEIKSEVHFIRQEFMSSLAALEKGRGRSDKSNRALFDALDSVKRYNLNEAPVPIAVLLEVIDKLKGYNFLVVCMLYYDSQVRLNRSEHVEVVKKVLNRKNPEWDPKGFEYDPQKKRLKLSGSISTLSMAIESRFTEKSLIHTLAVKHLDLRGADKIFPGKMKNLKLESLDVRGHKIHIAFDTSTAKVIYLDEDKVPAAVLEKIKESSVVNP